MLQTITDKCKDFQPIIENKGKKYGASGIKP
jgi:hypothetical protein